MLALEHELAVARQIPGTVLIEADGIGGVDHFVRSDHDRLHDGIAETAGVDDRQLAVKLRSTLEPREWISRYGRQRLWRGLERSDKRLGIVVVAVSGDREIVGLTVVQRCVAKGVARDAGDPAYTGVGTDLQRRVHGYT